jgi:hypothetical protein
MGHFAEPMILVPDFFVAMLFTVQTPVTGKPR